jgi:predicted ABC-class ATPase
VEDARALRAQREPRGLVAFIADGANLPRQSGVDDRPLGDGAIAFRSPPSLRVELEAPNAGVMQGLGVPAGVTLIVGGGFHGKSGEHEPITPFIDRARQLADEQGVSTILVMGGSGDYFDVATTVVAMADYAPADVSAEARRVADTYPTRRRRESGPWRPLGRRVPLPESIDARRGRRAVHVRTRSADRIVLGAEEVELSAVEQIVEAAQSRAMAETLAWARGRWIDGTRDVNEALHGIMEVLARDGLDVVQPQPTGELAAFRFFELAAFLCRIRGLASE